MALGRDVWGCLSKRVVWTVRWLNPFFPPCELTRWPEQKPSRGQAIS